MQVVSAFYRKYFSDTNERTFIFGINPGRFGGGVTGIPFTDPVRLQTNCGISNDFQKRGEISAEFVYMMIEAYGGPEKFYKQFFLTAISPVGFVKYGSNLNYYDEKELERSSTPFVIETMLKQLKLGARRDIAVCLGTGKNFNYFEKLNAEHGFFDKLIPLEHPRFIMQYRRKRLDEFISKYIETLARLIR